MSRPTDLDQPEWAGAWLEDRPPPGEAAVPPWLPVGPGTAVVDDVPDLEDLWLDQWPAPEQPWRQRALSALIPTLVLLLATAGLVAITAYAYRADEPRDRTYLPVDGAYAQVSWNDESGGQLEQGVGDGSGVLMLGMAGAVVTEGNGPDWPVQHDLWVADVASESGRLRAVLVVDQDTVSVLSMQTDDDVVAFRPMLPFSTGEVRGQDTQTIPGQQFGVRGAGSTSTAIVTRSGSGDCLDWSARVTTPSGSARPLTLQLRACRGSGLEQVGFAREGADPVDVTVTGSAAATGRWDGEITTAPVTVAASARWKPRALTAQRRDVAGTNPIFPVIQRDPVLIGDKRFLAIGNDNSLNEFVVGDTVDAGWSAHPGGRIAQVIAAGDLIIVATDQRGLVAYDPDGRRVWQVTLSDIAGEMVVVGDALIITTFTGQVSAHQVRTGTQLWSTELDSVRVSPGLAASSEVVAVVDADYAVHVFDFATGDETGDTGGGTVNGLAMREVVILVLRSDRLLGFDTRSTERVIDIDLGTGRDSQLAMIGSTAVVRGPQAVVTVDTKTGNLLDRQPTAPVMTSANGVVAVARDASIDVYSGAPAPKSHPVEPDGEPSALGAGAWGVVAAFGKQIVVIA